MTKYIGIAFFGIITISCASLKEGKTSPGNFQNGLSIRQGTKEININSLDTVISLSKSAFTFEFNLQQYDPDNKEFYSSEIAITDNKENLIYFQEGPIGDKNPFFSSGTGNAGPSSGMYKSIYLKKNGHHHIFYSSPDYRRAALVKKLNPKNYRVKWDINSITQNKVAYSMDSIILNTAYFMYFNDQNLNDTIEREEYHRIQINFE